MKTTGQIKSTGGMIFDRSTDIHRINRITSLPARYLCASETNNIEEYHMKTNHWTKTIGVLLLSLGLFKPAGGFAQMLSIQSGSAIDVAQPAQPDSLVQIAAESQGLAQIAPEDLPIIGGTFWWVMPGGNAVPAPCLPLDLSGAVYQIADGQFLVDETGGQVVVNTHRFGLAQATSSTVASEVASQADAVVNLITQVQATAANQQMQAMAGNMMAMDVPSPGDGGDGGTNSYTPNGSGYTLPDYGTNLWIAQVGTVSGNLLGTMSNSIGDVSYEIQSRTNLSQSDWASEGFINGSELTNWTMSVAQNGRPNLFLRIRSWIDSDNVGIPDWWQLLYFGYVGIDPNAPDPAGDGYSNLQKYQMGLNPNAFTPPPVNDFIAILSTNGTDVMLEWDPSPGSVQNYALGRYDFNWTTYNYDFTPIGPANGNTTSFDDVGAISNGRYYQDTYYQIQAVYTNGASQIAYAWWIQSSPPTPSGITVSYNANNGTASVNWQPSPGAVTGYTILRQNNAASGFTAIATVPAGQTSYVDNSYPGGFDVEYEVEANYAQSSSSPSDPANPRTRPDYTVPAFIVRGPQGLLYLTVSAIPQNTTTFRVYRTNSQASYYPISNFGLGIYTWEDSQLFTASVGDGYFDVPVTNFNNGVYKLTSSQAPPYGTYGFQVQALSSDGMAGDKISTGYATADSGRADYNIPFFDGRTNIAQNINFLLRSVQVNAPFNLDASIWAYGYGYWGDTNYVFAGFHFCNNLNNSPLVLNEFQPFEENNYYANLCFAPANVDANGNSDTGVSILYGSNPSPGNVQGFSWHYFTFIPYPQNPPPTYFFDTYGLISGASSPSFATVLPAPTAQWISYINSEDPSTTNYTIPNEQNVYGLAFESVKWPGYSHPPQFPIAYPGNVISAGLGTWFYQFAPPTLSAAGYYFARHYIDPLPGEPNFSVTNTTPSVIFASVGQPFSITAWAKQSLQNGYSGKFAYAEQYFDKAYKADTNGNATANQTGILSEYGEFFPTEPGQVILTTKADATLNTVGQCTVNVISLNVDANHDGTMNLSFSGPDQTSINKPYIFWCNNNFDRWHTVDGTDHEQDDMPPQSAPDCNYTVGGTRVIPCTRDLEDFSRLWISGVTSNLLAALPSGSTVTLSWGDVGNPNSSNPTIDLFQAADANGGTGYLTNSTIAAQQTNNTQCLYIGRLAPGGSLQLNAIQFNDFWAGNYFIWCGVANGSGQLSLTFADASGRVLGQASVYIQIVDIKQMYERWTVGDNTAAPPATTAYLAGDLPSDMTQSFQYTTLATTNTPYILFVHGWNLPLWEKDSYAETAFKRLYWQGYQGRFGEFRWPTYYGFPLGEFSSQAVNPRNFDNSEYNAWLSGAGLLNKLTDLNAAYSGNVYLMAHSLGNVVAGEALRLAGSSHVVNTYIAMQGAVAAHCYDPTTANRSGTFSTPDRYAQYYTNGAPCYFNGSAGAGTYVNFFNTNDYALHSSTFSWEYDQNTKPDNSITGYPGYHYNVSSLHPNGFYVQYGSGTNQFQNLNFPGDTYTIFSYCDQARSYALGAQVGVAGAFATNKEVNLSQSPYSFNQTHKFHSGEFRSDNAQRWQFWNTVLVQMRLNN